eukprot:CCRYP_014987-RB/>CCRYP_014987-RB protein AED:0.38 eAED:0.38 QI:0/0/0.5/1/0/0/2/93/136
MATLEFVRAYIDDLLCITKGTLEDHLAKLELVLSRLQDANLKVNARKSNFCAIETEYLGYILSRDGIKPQPKKGLRSILMVQETTWSRHYSEQPANSFFSRKLSVCQQKYSVTEIELLAIVETLKESKGCCGANKL